MGGCLRVVTRGMAVGARFRSPRKGANASLRGASGTPPPTVCPGMGGSGEPPLIRPCRGHLPPRGRQGLLLAAAEGRGRGAGTPPYGWGYGNAAGATWAPVPGPPRGRGRALRGLSVGPGQWFGPKPGEGFAPPRVLAAAGQLSLAGGNPPRPGPGLACTRRWFGPREGS